MTFALTKVQAYGIEVEEALNKRYRQYLLLNITAANTDTALDLGSNQTGSLGTFWTAVSGTAPGSGALTAIQDIVTRAECSDGWGGNWLSRAQIDATAAAIQSYDSAASAGGAATEALAVVGLAVADTILAVSQQAKGGNSTALNLWTDAARTADVLTVGWTANPGSGSIVRVLVRKASAAASVGAGSYTVAYANKTPNFTFASGDAPTSYEVVLKWILTPQTGPVEYYAST